MQNGPQAHTIIPVELVEFSCATAKKLCCSIIEFYLTY